MEVDCFASPRRWIAACALCVLLCCGTDACPAQTQPSLPSERLKAFQWLSNLGFPDIKEAKFVRLRDGSDQRGFLLSENKEAWAVVTIGLVPRTIERKRRLSSGRTVETNWVPEDFAAFVNSASHEPPHGYGPLDHEFEYGLSKATKCFVIAWICRRRGLDEQAAQWFDRAVESMKEAQDQKESPQNEAPERASPIQRLRWRVAAELAGEELDRVQIDLQKPQVSRAEVLERLIRLDGRYPATPAAARAQTMAIALKRMVREDREHTQQEKEAKPFARRSRQSQIAELIFQLREQGGQAWSLHDSIDIFAGDHWRGHEVPNSAKRLVDIGYDAVPQLITALFDDGISRAVDYRASSDDLPRGPHWYVLTVGDCVLRILERISGQSFWEDRRTFVSESPARLAEVKRKVDAWNLALQRDLKLKGAVGVLAEAIQAGDWKKVPLAERLVAHYPESALPALASAAGKSKDNFAQSRFVQLMGEIPGERTIPFLLAELKKSPSLYVRAELAWLLQNRGRREAVDAMVAQWKAAASKADSDPSLVEVAFFLGACRKLEAVQALAANLNKRPPDARLAVLASFAHREHMGGSGSSTRFFDVLFHRRCFSDLDAPVVTRNDTAVVGPVVDLLVSELEDTESLGDIDGEWNDKRFAYICIGDVAARALNQLDGTRFPFDISADKQHRDAARAVIRDGWRKRRGLPPIPTPKPHEIAPIPASTMVPLLDRLQKSSATERDVVTGEIEKLGPGAVVEIFKRRDHLQADDPIRPILDRTGRRLANTIVEVQLADRSLKPDHKLADRLACLKAEPLDSERFRNFVINLTKDLSKPARGFRLNVVRKGVASGIVLRLDLLDKPRADATINVRWPVPNGTPWDQPYAWHSGMKCQANGNSIYQVYGAAKEFHDSSLASMANDAFHVDLSQRLEIDVEAIGMWRE
ncbi:MAG TPA: hypothetical protein VGP76_01870 [Planctomycetaceae bacterium]|jgi:hypothetical protein|nr:hypothetical protein [Planctomycetaceae bacterium]